MRKTIYCALALSVFAVACDSDGVTSLRTLEQSKELKPAYVTMRGERPQDPPAFRALDQIVAGSVARFELVTFGGVCDETASYSVGLEPETDDEGAPMILVVRPFDRVKDGNYSAEDGSDAQAGAVTVCPAVLERRTRVIELTFDSPGDVRFLVRGAHLGDTDLGPAVPGQREVRVTVQAPQ